MVAQRLWMQSKCIEELPSIHIEDADADDGKSSSIFDCRLDKSI